MASRRIRERANARPWEQEPANTRMILSRSSSALQRLPVVGRIGAPYPASWCRGFHECGLVSV